MIFIEIRETSFNYIMNDPVSFGWGVLIGLVLLIVFFTFYGNMILLLI